jgi:lysozyme
MTLQLNSKGMDLSHYQVVTDWKAVKADGVEFVYIKATEGNSYADPKADSHFKGAKGVGLARGFYHFAHFSSVDDALLEAKWLVSHIQNYDFTLPPCLDLESNNCASTAILAQAAKAFLQYVEDKLGSAVLYCSKEYYSYVKDQVVDFGIWLAYPAATLSFVKPLSDLFAWQNNWHGAVKGVSGEVDLDVAGGKVFTVTNKMLAPQPAIVEVKPAPVANPAPVVAKPAPVVAKPEHKPAPKPAPKPKKAPKPTTYTVKSGDALVEIAAKFGLTVEKLQKWNGIPNPNMIYAGQVLKLVATKSTASRKPVTHTVQSGETLISIADKFKTTVRSLQKLNKISDVDKIKADQVLRVK